MLKQMFKQTRQEYQMFLFKKQYKYLKHFNKLVLLYFVNITNTTS